MCAKKIALIAGNGSLPELLIDALKSKKITPYLIGFDGQTPPSLGTHEPAIWTTLGKTGHAFKTLNREGITDLIMIGGMTRPKLWQLRPDFETLKFYLSLGFDLGGDDHFLKKLERFLNKKGFIIRGAHEFLDEYLAPAGLIGDIESPESYNETIAIGIAESQKLGAADLGQSVIIQGDQVIAREDKSGTDALIREAYAHIDPNLPPPILVKTCKPQQDMRFDLPTIGPNTIQNCADHGFGGVVIHARKSFLIEKDKVCTIANNNNVFIKGIEIS